jgi:hypothetical protein
MTNNAAPGSAATAPPKTLADKVNWVLDKAHTAGRGRMSDAEVVFKIHEVTGEKSPAARSSNNEVANSWHGQHRRAGRRPAGHCGAAGRAGGPYHALAGRVRRHRPRPAGHRGPRHEQRRSRSRARETDVPGAYPG